MAISDVLGGGTFNFEGVPLSAGASVGTGSRSTSTTGTTPDPWRDFFLRLVTSQLMNRGASVPQYTLDRLAGFTANPAVAPQDFENISKPLIQSLAPGEARETQTLRDQFRKSGVGSLQSGAFASEARKLVGDQATRRNTLLASNYVPLTNQVSQNVINAIRLGLGLPEAEAAGLKTPASLAASLAPLSTSTTQSGVNVAPGPSLLPSVINTQAATGQQNYQNWWNWWNK